LIGGCTLVIDMSVLCACKASNSLYRRQNEARVCALFGYLDSVGFNIGIPWATMNFSISI
jgi:hypothetical protein